MLLTCACVVSVVYGSDGNRDVYVTGEENTCDKVFGECEVLYNGNTRNSVDGFVRKEEFIGGLKKYMSRCMIIKVVKHLKKREDFKQNCMGKILGDMKVLCNNNLELEIRKAEEKYQDIRKKV